MSVYVLWFMLYSFGGWLWELIFNRVVSKIWRWHGYLTLPLLPIYGFSALGILLLVQPYIHNPALVFIAAAAIVNLIEFITSYILEKVFHLKLWDYSDWPLNIGGRVSLFSALGFGFMGLVLVYVLQPSVVHLISQMPEVAINILALALSVLFIIDYLNSTASIIRLRADKGNWSASFSGMQKNLERRIAMLRQERRKFRVAIDQWYRINLDRLNRAYPKARITVGRGKKSTTNRSSVK